MPSSSGPQSFQFQDLTSAANPKFKSILRASENDHDELCVVPGLRFLDSVPAERIEMIAVSESWFEKSLAVPALKSLREAILRPFPNPISRLKLGHDLFQKVNSANVPDGLIICRRRDLKSLSFENLLNELNEPVLLATARNPLNLGAQVRSAVAFGIQNLVLMKGSASIDHSQVARSSAGASLRIRTFQSDSLSAFAEYLATQISSLSPKMDRKIKPQSSGIGRLVAFDLGGTELSQFEFPQKPIFVFGEEGLGLSEFKSIQTLNRVTIPISPEVESLNLGVTTGIALYEWSHRRG